ncbi:contractile injection system protein, VgrG/Pvc8 family [Flavobacterium hercynium]|uniref:Gp5/Type VI secretion system Vgr protein OB-fold domain-containing protein n=1 Tax=Flavobacterium hercynium TaxID=387094 RepID=A0A226HKV2_9FLAO|nr:contractile injection system protein, VgrG/Pvc8 family [Flavobacterium hercynium]OXA94734.1 hypothetical protein B0A66_03125 [Flavobacterium hercynium]SMP07638.1 Uncharacterized conserved protein, implicated in type VI secretion and phage assembly [Flavobacterium hercynium]
MALQTNTKIKIGEITITNFSNLIINQEIHAHNTFSVEVRQDLLVLEYKSVMPVSQRLYGEKVTIEVKPIDGLDDLLLFNNRNDYALHFSGIVTKIKTRKSRFEDLEETLFISGHSCSILLDDGLKCNSFTNKSLNDIVSEVKAGYDIDMNIFAFYKNLLPYTVQYNETTFNFLNRLAKRYGHYFYDNGRVMVFGAPGTSGGEPTLVYGANMQEFSYEMKVLPSQLEIIENDNRLGNYATDQTLKYRNECDGFQQNFLNKSNTIFNQTAQQQLNQNPAGGSGKTALEEYTKNKMRAVLGKLMQVTAKSEVAGITLGNSVRITGVDVQLESSYCITSITHVCEDQGTYENHFTAVNLNGSVFSPQTNPDLVPHCVSQTAIVTANADPDGLSFVQVQMPWQQVNNKTTPYIPLLQDYGGSGRGSHIIPEVGDTILVEFQGENAELPIVRGIMTNNKQKSGFSTPGNDLKVLATRSGNQLMMNDSAGSILVQDASNSQMLLDGNHKISLRADTLHIDVKQLIMNASESTEVTTNDYTLNALSKIYATSKKMKQVIKGFMNFCSGKVLLNSDDTIDIEGKVVKLHGKKQALVHSDEEAMINSLGTAKIHGAQGNSFTNSPQTVNAAPTDIVELATVYFRPLPTWRGEFGFDWLREKDNGINIKPDYKSIIESGYKDGITDLTKAQAFEKLKKEYEIIPIAGKTKAKKKSKPGEYFVPYLSLFSKEFVDSLSGTATVAPPYEAELKVLIDIEEDLDRLEFEYDGSLLQINQNVLTEKNKTKGLVDKNITIKITCLHDLDTDHEINIYAYPKTKKTASGILAQPNIDDRKLAGRINVLPNNSTIRKEEKFALIKVKTQLDPTIPAQEGEFTIVEKKNLYNTLHQALIVPIVEEVSLDLVGQPNFSLNGKNTAGQFIFYSGYINGVFYENHTLFSDCQLAFLFATDPNGNFINTKYNHYFTIFKFGIPSTDLTLLGHSENIGTRNVILYSIIGNTNDYIIAHESMHGFGLLHSHRDDLIIKFPNFKYIFPCYNATSFQPTANPMTSTNNIMSYNRLCYSSWYWQWKIVNPNIP